MASGTRPNFQLAGVLTPTLHFDILAYTMSLMESRRDLLPLMMTCRSLHSAGTPYLLRLLVVLSTLREGQSFCAFMLAETNQAIRFQNFRRLKIEPRFELALDDSEDDTPVEDGSIRDLRSIVDDLAKVLSHSRQLEYLYLSESETFLKISPNLRAALLQLSALREFDVSGTGKLSAGLLMEMRMPLASLVLQLDPNEFPPNSVIPSPFDLLRNFCASLNEVSLWSVVIGIGSIAVRCPSVQRLTIHVAEPLNVLSIEPLLLAFPNVTQFTSVVYVDQQSVEFNDLARDANRETLRRHQPLWSKLDLLSGSLSTLRSLGVITPVRYLDIEEFACPREVSIFHQLLEDLQPTHLDIDLTFNEWEIGGLDQVLSKVFQSTSLSHLVVVLSMGREHQLSKVHPQALLQELLPNIRGSSIAFLALYVFVLPRFARPLRYEWSSYYDRGDSARFFGEEFVHEIAKAAPALSHLYLMHERRIPSFWSIRRDESGAVMLESQPEELGFRMMEKAREQPPISGSQES